MYPYTCIYLATYLHNCTSLVETIYLDIPKLEEFFALIFLPCVPFNGLKNGSYTLRVCTLCSMNFTMGQCLVFLNWSELNQFTMS